MENPKIRPVQAFPLQASGREMIGMKDPTGISPGVVIVPPETFFLISMMDGTNSIRDLQAAYMRKYAELLFSDKLEGLIQKLDASYLLDNVRFQDHLRRLREEFKKANVRKPAFSGGGYEENPDRLKEQLRGYFIDQEGPGLPEEKADAKAVRGIIAPHIDFARGGVCYAYAYKTLAQRATADLYVILGTCHTPMQNPLALTKKGFETPLGIAVVDTELAQSVAEQFPYDSFEDEFSHRGEHSIEFQVLFLQYVLAETEFTILPILCRSFHETIQQGSSPMQDTAYRQSIDALKEVLFAMPTACLVASVDLAHVGPQFGGTEKVTPGVLADVKSRDLEMLIHVQELDAEGFYQSIIRERDERNICGLPPIYTFLHLIRAQKGELLRYQQWCDPQGTGTVTFTSMAFF